LFLICIVLTNPLQAAFDPTLDIGRIESQTEVEDLRIVALVVADGGPAGETFFPYRMIRSRPWAQNTRVSKSTSPWCTWDLNSPFRTRLTG
jgi:hypothetical protein